jgi:hypothetical protein
VQPKIPSATHARRRPLNHCHGFSVIGKYPVLLKNGISNVTVR